MATALLAVAALTPANLHADTIGFWRFDEEAADDGAAIDTAVSESNSPALDAPGQGGSAYSNDVPGTLIFYESPKRAAAMLSDASEVLGPDRQVALCRELTKKFEETLQGTLSELAAICQERTLKGEIVIVIDRGALAVVNEDDLDMALIAALKDHSVRDATDLVTARLKLKRRRVYQRALELGKQADEAD